jgi:hypothetical protein
MKSMFENFPISKFVYDSPLYYTAVSQTLNSNNSANTKFENIVSGVSGPQMEFFNLKKRR